MSLRSAVGQIRWSFKNIFVKELFNIVCRFVVLAMYNKSSLINPTKNSIWLPRQLWYHCFDDIKCSKIKQVLSMRKWDPSMANVLENLPKEAAVSKIRRKPVSWLSFAINVSSLYHTCGFLRNCGVTLQVHPLTLKTLTWIGHFQEKQKLPNITFTHMMESKGAHLRTLFSCVFRQKAVTIMILSQFQRHKILLWKM